MASQKEHDIINAVTHLIAKVGSLPPSSEKSDVIAAVEDLREKLGAVGYNVARPAWMGTGLAQSRSGSQ